MIQGDLFGDPTPVPPPLSAPIVRATDPGTSHAAAREQVESGRRESHCALILRLEEEHPGSTYRELWRLAGGQIAEAVEVQRRLGSDLAELDPTTGFERPGTPVVRGEARRCTVSNRPAQTWWPRATAIDPQDEQENRR